MKPDASFDKEFNVASVKPFGVLFWRWGGGKELSCLCMNGYPCGLDWKSKGGKAF